LYFRRVVGGLWRAGTEPCACAAHVAQAIVFICAAGADSTSRFDRKNASRDGKPWRAGLGADTGTKWNHLKNAL
jgi:hypothetical protein